jgi:hypothetical protein
VKAVDHRSRAFVEDTGVLWICRECGTEVSAASLLLVASLGWIGLDGDTGVCAPCAGKAKADDRADGDSSIRRRTDESLDRSERALATSRVRIDRNRQPT